MRYRLVISWEVGERGHWERGQGICDRLIGEDADGGTGFGQRDLEWSREEPFTLETAQALVRELQGAGLTVNHCTITTVVYEEPVG